MTRRVLITGAGGFVGHHFLEHVLANTDYQVVCTDSFRHKGKVDRIQEVLSPEFYTDMDALLESVDWKRRTTIVTHDLTAPFSNQTIEKIGDIDYIVAFASESHVDRSIEEPVPFIENNVSVVLNTLELARKVKPRSFVLISTDEVYGPVEETDMIGHPEWDTIMPSNPYSASKAAQEAIAYSYWRTYNVPLQIVNCMNMIGERQDPEKFIPLVLSKVLKGEPVTIHASSELHIGTRHYLHARNLADGILFMLAEFPKPAKFGSPFFADAPLDGKPDRFNIASHDRIDNLTMARMIANYAGKRLIYKLEDFHSTRPGHDPHYGLDPAKLESRGWMPPIPLETSLKKTVDWTMAHPSWLLPD